MCLFTLALFLHGVCTRKMVPNWNNHKLGNCVCQQRVKFVDHVHQLIAKSISVHVNPPRMTVY